MENLGTVAVRADPADEALLQIPLGDKAPIHRVGITLLVNDG
jgi:hypothetical protein